MPASKVGEAYIELQARMAKFESQLRSAEVMTGKSVGKMQAKFQALAPTFRKVGMGMAVAGGAITAALGLTIKSAMSFNKEMANIATLIPGATERVIELKGEIRSMAVEVGKSTGDLAQGGYQVISAFGDTADTVDILRISARAATAGVATTTDAINLLGAVTKGYGDTSKEAQLKVSDLAFQTVKLGVTDFPQLAASIGQVVPLTSELGVSQAELFAVMATGTGVTGKAAQVSTQLRGVMQALMAPSADMIKLLEEKGYASGKAMIADLGLIETLNTIKSVSEASNAPLQKYIGSIEGQTIALALTGAQADIYIEKLAAMKDSAGMTDAAFREQTEGINKAGFAFQQAKIRIGILGQEIGDRLLPMITPLIEKITELVKKMSDWAKEHPGLSSGIVKVAAVLGPLLIMLGGVLIILPKLIALVPILKIAMIKLGGAFHFMLGPIGLIITAIGAAVAAFIYFYKTSDKFRNFIDNIVAYIKAFVQNAWNRLVWLKDNWGALWKTIFEGLPKIAKNAFDNLITIFKWLWDFIKGWGSWLGKNFINVWRNMFSAITTAVKNFGDNIWQQLKWIGEKMKPQNWFKKIERPDWTPLLEGFEAVWEEMPKIAELQLKKLTEGVENFMEPLPELVKPVLKAVKEGAEGASDAIDSITIATDKYITTFDALLKLRGKDKELTEEEKKRIKELEEAQKAAQEEIKKIRATSFEEWQAQNEARTKELYAELDKQKKIQKDAKDEIANIRKMSFKEWQAKNEARTKELYDELATQKQIQKDAKSKIADIRKMSFEDWKKKNEARTKELYEELAKQKQIQKDAKDEIINIRKMSFKEWQAKNEARTKELYAELAKQKQIEKDAKDKIIDIRKMSFEDWQKKNEARTKELYAELAVQKQIQKDAKNEIADIRKMSFEDWQKKNEARTKELYAELAKQERIEQDAKDEIAKIRQLSFEEWQAQNEVRTKELYDEMFKQEQIHKAALERMTTNFKDSFSNWIKEGQTFGEFWKGLCQKLADTWVDQFIDVLLKEEPFKKLIALFTEVFASISAGIVKIATGFLGIIKRIPGIVVELGLVVVALGAMAWAMENVVIPAFNWLVGVIGDAIGWILNFAKQVAEKLGGLMGSVAKLFADIIKGIGGLFSSLWDLLKGIFDWIFGTLEDLNDELRKIWEYILGVTGDVNNALDDLSRRDIRIPINFDVGEIHMPKIPSYQVGIPYVPRTHIGVLHPKEAVLTAPQAREWRTGKAGGGVAGNVTFQRGAVIMRVQNLNTKADVEQLVDLVEDTMTKTIEKKMKGF